RPAGGRAAPGRLAADRRCAPGRPAPRRTARSRGTGSGPTPSEVAALAPHRLRRPTEQNHIYLGGHGITALSEDRHALSVLMSILGGGMSSRLFQNIREQRGLAYSVFSFSAGYRDAGLFGMYAACRPG